MSIRNIVAKTDKESTDYWLPLWMHGKDTEGILRKLIRHWIPYSVQKSIGMDLESLEKIASFLGILHDIGKATSRFQSVITIRFPELRHNLSNEGFRILDSDDYLYPGKTPHAHAGEWILLDERMNYMIDDSLAHIVGAHHGKPLNSPELNREDNLVKAFPQNYFGDHESVGIWVSAWNELIHNAVIESNVSTLELSMKINPQGQVLLSGLLIIADWIASNTSYFPLIPLDDKSIYTEIYPERVDQAWSKLKFPELWTPGIQQMTGDLFEERFGFIPNNVQKQMMEIINHVQEPGVYILEAQMGVGKTEAALAASDVLATKFGCGGIFFGLPSQATSNGLFPRLVEWAEGESEDTVLSIKLAHGASDLNEQYEELLFKGYAQIDDLEEYDINGISAHPWFQGSKKSLLSNFVIGTVDQLLMSGLARKHFMLRHIGLAGKVVIVDECHAYDAYMNQFLDRVLEWLAAYGIPVILLSATLPSERRLEIVKSYIKSYQKHCKNEKWEKGDLKKLEANSMDYPLITWTDGGKINQKKVSLKADSKKVIFSEIHGADFLTETLKEKMKDGGCVAIIANTVKSAQNIYNVVKAEFDNTEYTIILYHAQFCMTDRVKKEELILEKTGKRSTFSKRNNVIIIGTQVLEQSLDYDVDLMITQICPMDLLLQRIGRLHRHPRNNRPDLLKIAECILLKEVDTEYDQGSSTIYGDWLLMRTLKVLPEMIVIPDDIPFLVQKVYDKNDDLNIKSANYDVAKEHHFEKLENKKNRAVYRLVFPRKRKGIRGILDNPDVGSEVQAELKVRDGESSLEVLIMIKIDGRKARFPEGHQEGTTVPLNESPSYEIGKMIAREKIRLPYALCTPWNIDHVIDDLEELNRREIPCWQESPWIKGELVLLLNADQRIHLHKYDLCYDSERGLSYEQTK